MKAEWNIHTIHAAIPRRAFKSPIGFVVASMLNKKILEFLQGFSLCDFSLLYPEWDLNPHDRNGHRILSPACLPIPPSGQNTQIKKNLTINQAF